MWDCSSGWANSPLWTRLLKVNLLRDRHQNGVWFTKDTATSAQPGWYACGPPATLEPHSWRVRPNLHHSQDHMSKPKLTLNTEVKI